MYLITSMKHDAAFSLTSLTSYTMYAKMYTNTKSTISDCLYEEVLDEKEHHLNAVPF